MGIVDFLDSINPVLALRYGAICFLFYAFSWALYNRYIHPYRKFPGPFWASVSPLWYWRAQRFGRATDTQRPLHEKYGQYVRISPNQVQISDPAAIDIVYRSINAFEKDIFYSGFDPGISNRHGLFEERDEQIHAVRRRIVAPLYSQKSILEFEPCVDRVVLLFSDAMKAFVQSNETIDMALWLRKYAFDVIGEIFYGREGGFGFLRDNIDYNDWCKLMETMAAPAAANMSVPWGFRTLFFAAEMLFPETRVGAIGFFDVIKQSRAAVSQRLRERASGEQEEKNDLLKRLLDLVNNDPDPKVYWDLTDVTVEIWTTIWAGSDTTAIAMTSAFYHLHKNPGALAKLRQEIDAAFVEGRLSYPLRFSACKKLPYLDAVIREAMRMHSSLGTGLPRIVPKGGAHIGGLYFPAGYGVIMNANAVNFDKTIFGDDAEQFVPERWLKGNTDGMDRYSLQFGKGSRICIGRNIAEIEMYKLLPAMLREFEFDGVSPGQQEWITRAVWFHNQKGVNVTVRKRTPDLVC